MPHKLEFSGNFGRFRRLGR